MAGYATSSQRAHEKSDHFINFYGNKRNTGHGIPHRDIKSTLTKQLQNSFWQSIRSPDAGREEQESPGYNDHR